jgi:hypothetical protein
VLAAAGWSRPGAIAAAGLAATSGFGYGGVALAAQLLLTGDHDLFRLIADPLLRDTVTTHASAPARRGRGTREGAGSGGAARPRG